MPYASGTRLPGESASKLGHLAVLESDWVRSLVTEFESDQPAQIDTTGTLWQEADTSAVEPLRSVWAVDGSFVPIRTQESPPKEVAFVKTALLTVDSARLAAIDKEHPHPLLIRDVLTGSGIFHATVFPLKNIRTPMGSNYEAIRHIVRDSIKLDEGGAFYDTLKWLAYEKWSGSGTTSPAFGCPHCAGDHPGLPFDADAGPCPLCGKQVYLTDMIGFHLDMDEQSAPDSIASRVVFRPFTRGPSIGCIPDMNECSNSDVAGQARVGGRLIRLGPRRPPNLSVQRVESRRGASVCPKGRRVRHGRAEWRPVGQLTTLETIGERRGYHSQFGLSMTLPSGRQCFRPIARPVISATSPTTPASSFAVDKDSP